MATEDGAKDSPNSAAPPHLSSAEAALADAHAHHETAWAKHESEMLVDSAAGVVVQDHPGRKSFWKPMAVMFERNYIVSACEGNAKTELVLTPSFCAI